jgi:hypothetical protein
MTPAALYLTVSITMISTRCSAYRRRNMHDAPPVMAAPGGSARARGHPALPSRPGNGTAEGSHRADEDRAEVNSDAITADRRLSVMGPANAVLIGSARFLACFPASAGTASR